MQPASITVVSGLPRSGTSLLMQMLRAGGLPIVSGGLRHPDRHNPRGYLEDERVKGLATDASWLGEARGRAIKVVSPLLHHLPPEHRYRVVFVHRDLAEVVASQRAMAGEIAVPEALASTLQRHLERVERWLERRAHIEVLRVDYNALVAGHTQILDQLPAFLGVDLSAPDMVAAIDPGLYRVRMPARD